MNEIYSIQDRCLNALIKGPMTADEVADEIGEHLLAVRPAITMLKDLGNIEYTGMKRPNKVSGKKAHVLKLTCMALPPVIPIATESDFAFFRHAKKIGFNEQDARNLITSTTDPVLLNDAAKLVFSA
jgi:hypothetical protein